MSGWNTTRPRSFINSIAIPLAAKGTVTHTTAAPAAPAAPAAVQPFRTSGTGEWVALDATVKQFTYARPANLNAINGFDPNALIDQIRAGGVYSDAVGKINSVPGSAVGHHPGQPGGDRPSLDVTVDDVISKTTAYLAANPNLTTLDVFGGSAIVTKTFATVPAALPFTVLPDPAMVVVTNLPSEVRAYLTVEVMNRSGTTGVMSYTASLPSLVNQRVTISYACGYMKTRLIDSHGGSLITSPPVPNLCP